MVAPIADYVSAELVPLVLVHLSECQRQLDASSDQSIMLLLAARSAHSALITSLTAALAGSDSSGAFTRKVREAWLGYLSELRDDTPELPPSDRVMKPTDLLQVARTEARGYLQEPLEVDMHVEHQIRVLTWLRNRVEHPRAEILCIAPSMILQAVAASIALTRRCIEAVWHHLDDIERSNIEVLSGGISSSCERLGLGER